MVGYPMVGPTASSVTPFRRMVQENRTAEYCLLLAPSVGRSARSTQVKRWGKGAKACALPLSFPSARKFLTCAARVVCDPVEIALQELIQQPRFKAGSTARSNLDPLADDEPLKSGQ